MTTPRSRARRSMPVIVTLDGDNTHLANLCGPLDENLRQLADGMTVKLSRRGSRVTIEGERAELAGRILRRFHEQAVHRALSIDDIQLGLVEIGVGRQEDKLKEEQAQELDALPALDDESDGIALRTKRSDLRPRTPRQRDYLNNILKHDITFGVGPAGTGKTWLAVACAIDAMERDTVQRLVLTRPAVEAGERLGFLPGDLAQKVDPYLRPLYDALYDLMGFEKVQRLFEKQTIEIAPLAYMRGRTLNHAFVILDEAQNTTPEQMKMFLTRIGFGSKAVITGDPSQVDLPRGQVSGLAHAVKVLHDVQGIATTKFTSRDVVRHPWSPASSTPTTALPKMKPELSLSVQYGVEEARLPRWRLRRWAERALGAAHEDGLVAFSAAELSLRLVGAAEGRRLNRDFRGRDYATNVLTFEYGVDPLGVARGDIVMCVPVLVREAREQRKPLLDHAAHLTIHGVLHSLGYDHIKAREAKRMEALETATLAQMGIADPYVAA